MTNISPAEGEVRRLERDLVRGIFTTEGCMRTGFFSGFSVANPTGGKVACHVTCKSLGTCDGLVAMYSPYFPVHYENPELPLLAGRCKYCWCCR